MTPIIIEYDETTGCLTVEKGKIIICFLEDREELRILRTADKQLLKTESFVFQFSEFIKKVNHYSKLTGQ